MKALIISGLLLLAGWCHAEAEINLVDPGFGGVIVVVTSEERFDPLVQQLLVKKQLDQHPHLSEPLFMVIHNSEEYRLTEMQIRYLEQLLGREAQ